MSAEFMKNMPVSGEYPEVHFGDHFQNRLWVLFEDNEYNQWIGCFSRDCCRGYDQVITDNLNQTALIIASGVGYLVDITNRRLIYQTNTTRPITSTIKTTNPEYFIVSSFDCIYILNANGLQSEISPKGHLIDGIYFKGQTDKIAFGEVDVLANQSVIKSNFSLNLETFGFRIDNEADPLKPDNTKNENIPKRFVFKRLKI